MIQYVLLFAIALLMSVSSVIAAQSPVARLVGAFLETIRSEAPVSGGDILGLVVFGDRMPKGAERIFVRKPTGGAGSVCVEMVSRDGRYIASGTYDLPGSAPGEYVFIPITDETKHPSIFRAAVIQNFAVMTRVGRCDQSGGALIPTAWGTPPPPAAIMRLGVTVQGARTRAFLRAGSGGQMTRFSCTSIHESRRTAFDAYCEFTLPAAAVAPIEVQLERCAFDECTRSPALQVSL